MIPKPMKLTSILWLKFLMGILLSSQSIAETDDLGPPIIARPGCKDICGNVSIPFPWGIGVNCFQDSWFEIECKVSPYSNSSTKLPFLSKLNIEVLELMLTGRQILRVRIPVLKVCTEDTHPHQLSSIHLSGSPYSFSKEDNIWIMEGCAGSVVVLDQSGSGYHTNHCYGVECCQTELFDRVSYPDNPLFEFYQIEFHKQPSGKSQNCLAATLIDSSQVNEYMGKLSTSDPPTIPIVLNWRWRSSLWPDPNNTHSMCYHLDSLICDCDSNSVGINPYVINGCQVPKSCKHCKGSCLQGQGNRYFCQQKAFRDYFTGTIAVIVYIALSVALGPLLIVFGCHWLYYFTKRKKKEAKRVLFFRLMLQRHQSSNNGVVESTKLFTHKELDKATDHFNDNRVLGKGGQGTVDKGMLTDGRIVAIKKSVLMDESQMEQFINEVVVLSLINHRNVVKLLGCCLETEVPLLAYEFISNGTLYQHIHHPTEDFSLSWDMRLKIAADSAGAIAYLHSSSSTPIYHRDIKSANILLDDKHRAKVSDFGSSKTFEIDQTHLTTLVQGTIGYLDPEYFESSVFTEKSDVYSFGVVLLELLTGKKPIYRSETMEQKSLVTEFFIQMQNFSLPNLLDPEVVKDAKDEQLTAFADLAKRCLHGSGRFRPTMKEVTMALEMIIKFPDETSSQDLQMFRHEGFSEIVVSETSVAEFISSPFPDDAHNPLYIDVKPLLHDTI